MTKRQRAQVVELLRCAADLTPDDPCDMLADATGYLDAVGEYTQAIAYDAVNDVSPYGLTHDTTHDEERANLLEAAARVEEGSWP